MTALADRQVAPNVRLPIIPAPGTGVVTPSCENRDYRYPVAQHVGRMLRIGGEASLCFACGPQGGVYHPSRNDPDESLQEPQCWRSPCWCDLCRAYADFDPDAGAWAYTMEDVRAVAETIFLHDGDGSEPPTAAELAAFEVELRREMGL